MRTQLFATRGAQSRFLAVLGTSVLAATIVSAQAGMVSARWGVKGPMQHPGTLRFYSRAGGGRVMAVDLSALPKKARIYRARMLLSGTNWKEPGFDIVPARRVGTGDQAAIEADGDRLKVVAPWNQWLDATEAVRRWASQGAGTGLLWIRGRRSFDRGATILEIAY